MIHSLPEQLQFSWSKEGKLDRIYQSYFKNVATIKRINRMDRQRAGVDTEITLQSGEKYIIQEKWRTREFTGDFLIEYISVEKRGECIKRGWIYDIDADYLFVVYAPSQLVKIYPVAQLKLVWSENKTAWIRDYRVPPARNEGYNTHNIAVPCDILEKKLIDQMTFKYQQSLWSSLGEVLP